MFQQGVGCIAQPLQCVFLSVKVISRYKGLGASWFWGGPTM